MEISLKYVGKFSKFSSEIKKKIQTLSQMVTTKGGENGVFKECTQK